MSDTRDCLRAIARLERIAAERLDEIARLQGALLSEQEKTAQYSQQVDEMTDFLSDYGLHWVGGPGPAHAPLFPRGPTNMGEFVARIAALNAKADARPACQTVGGVTRLRAPSVCVHLADDGFSIDDGDLRPYAHPLSTDFFQDIMDGFFPAEFKARFPEGVTLVVDDRRAKELFKGDARRLVDAARRETQAEGERGWKTEIGAGDGQLKVRFGDGGETIVRTTEETTIARVKEQIEKDLGIVGFTLASPLGEAIEEGQTLRALRLFPKGLLLLIGR
jgi:hypothetical protein